MLTMKAPSSSSSRAIFVMIPILLLLLHSVHEYPKTAAMAAITSTHLKNMKAESGNFNRSATATNIDVIEFGTTIENDVGDGFVVDDHPEDKVASVSNGLALIRALRSALALQKNWFDYENGKWRDGSFWTDANAMETLVNLHEVTGNERKRTMMNGRDSSGDGDGDGADGDGRVEHAGERDGDEGNDDADLEMFETTALVSTIFHHQDSKHFVKVNGDTFFDDMEWWGLAWLRAYDLFGENVYLKRSKQIVDTVWRWGWDNEKCGSPS